MKFRVMIIMSLTILLSSSSFFLPSYLSEVIKGKLASPEQIAYATHIGLKSAYQYQLDTFLEGSAQWLKFAKLLADNDQDLALRLGKIYQQNNQIDIAITWYQHAILSNNEQAQLALGQTYFSLENYELSKSYLTPIINNFNALIILINIAITQGDLGFIVKHLNKLKQDVKGQELEEYINKYQIVESLENRPIINSFDINNNGISKQNSKSRQCLANVQLYATNIANLKLLDTLVSQFSEHVLAPYFCFEPIRYIVEAKLECNHQPEEAIQCNESIWSQVNESTDIRYIGIMLPKGGANVNTGIMYLDSQDTMQVFAHELSHLLGFVDEYPLPAQHEKCQKIQSEMFSHNIAVIDSFYQGKQKEVRAKVLSQLSWGDEIKNSTPILQATEKGWVVGTPIDYFTLRMTEEVDKDHIGVFNAITCKGTKLSAFKPINKITQLNYFEAEFPLAYINILNRKKEMFLMPSFDYNVAKSLFTANKEYLALHWLRKSLTKEKEKSPRYNKIKRGGY